MSHTAKDIKGSAGIRVNTFYNDTPLDIALRLLRHATLEVEDAVNDLVSTNSKPTLTHTKSAQSDPKRKANT